MCDAICKKQTKYAVGPAPYFPPPVVNAYPCHAVEVDTPIYEPLVKPVIKNIVQETTINVPKIEYRENIVEVPKVEYRPYPVIKEVQTPIYQDLYKYKDVEVPQKQYRIKPVYKEVDVPEIECVDKYVKRKYKRFKYVPKEVQIPFRPRKQIYEEVPVPRYIPQHLESVVRPDHIMGPPPSPLVNHPMPMCEVGDPCLIDPVVPMVPLKQSTPNTKCCLSSLFSPKKNSYEAGLTLPPIPQPQFWDPEFPMYNDIHPGAVGVYPPFPQYPPGQAVMGYSYPFIVEEEQGSDLCNVIIETTANVLAASGIALILAGKLTFDGINYLVNLSKNNKQKEVKHNYRLNSDTEEASYSGIRESTIETPKTENVNSHRSSDVTIDDRM